MRTEASKVIELNTSLCTGCALCQNLCPKNAISMQMGKNGFRYPVVDSDKCITCGICQKVCPCTLPPFDEGTEPLTIFAVKAKEKDVHMLASSGGAFILLSDLILQDGGVIYGCSFNDEWCAEHTIATSSQERNKMCGSKYVQSDVGSTYVHVGENLRNGIKVMFTGTPCQVDALHKYLQFRKINDDALITVDLICHGVPSPKTWKEHIESLEKRYKSKPKMISFRKKDAIGNSQALWVAFENGKEYFLRSVHDLYYKYFLKNYHLRPSCYNCRYTSLYRSSDITLGDFGGVSKVKPEFNSDHMGVSQVHINTEKGLQYFERIKERAEFFEISADQGMQPNLQHPSSKPKDCDKFERILMDSGLETASWRVSGVKEKIQWILNKINLSEILYRKKHSKSGGIRMLLNNITKNKLGGVITSLLIPTIL